MPSELSKNELREAGRGYYGLRLSIYYITMNFIAVCTIPLLITYPK